MKIELRKTRPEDIDYVVAVESSPENSPFIGSWDHNRHSESLIDSDIRHLIVEDSRSGRSLGYIILCGLDSSHKSLELMRIVIAEKERGIGRQCLKLVKDYTFSELKFNRLWLEVLTDNNRAKHLYTSSGFLIEGTLRESFFAHNRYLSVNLLSMLRSEYEKEIS